MRRNGSARDWSSSWITPSAGVLATLDELRRSRKSQSRNLHSIVDRIRPSVEGLLFTEPPTARVLLRLRQSVLVGFSVDQLHHGSETLERLIEHDALRIVGA